MLSAAIAGYILGFLGSVPVAGPIAVLVLERSLAQRYADAEGIAVGGAVAESFYAAAAFLGFGVLVQRFPVLLVVARAAGALILLVVAYALWSGRNRPIETRQPRTVAVGRLRGFGLGFSITAMNPTLLATWSVVSALAFGAFSLELGWGSAFSFPIGAGLGVASWLLIFVRILRRGGEKLSGRAQERIRAAMIAFVLVVALWFAYEAAAAYAG